MADRFVRSITKTGNNIRVVTARGEQEADTTTDHGVGEENVQPDWDATSGTAQILNKPTISNDFTNADKTKLDGIETSATADQSATEIRDALATLTGSARLDATSVKNIPTGSGTTGLASVASDTTLTGDGTGDDPLKVANPFTAADETKLDGIETGATADQTATEIRNLAGAASVTQTGLIEIATATEANTGTDTTRAIVPSTLRGQVGPRTNDAERTAGTSTQVRRFTPADIADMIGTHAAADRYRGSWTSNTTYRAGDYVQHQGAVRIAKTDHTAANYSDANFYTVPLPLSDAQIGDKAFSNPPSDLTETEKTAARSAIGAGTGGGGTSGLTSVSSDDTLTGDGTAGNTLKVANPFTDADETKLDGIAAGAEVNVNADWNATSGDAQILNKPTIPTVSDDSILDLAKVARTNSDRGRFLGTSDSNENDIVLRDAPTGGGQPRGAGTGLTLTGNNLGLSNGGVGTTQLAADAVTNAKLANNAVNAENIGIGQVQTDRIALNAIGLPEMKHGTANKYLGYDSTGAPAEKDAPSGSGEQNVNADWDATSGDAQILNKPDIPELVKEVYAVEGPPDTIDWTAKATLEGLNGTTVVLFPSTGEALTVNLTIDAVHLNIEGWTATVTNAVGNDVTLIAASGGTTLQATHGSATTIKNDETVVLTIIDNVGTVEVGRHFSGAYADLTGKPEIHNGPAEPVYLSASRNIFTQAAYNVLSPSGQSNALVPERGQLIILDNNASLTLWSAFPVGFYIEVVTLGHSTLNNATSGTQRLPSDQYVLRAGTRVVLHAASTTAWRIVVTEKFDLHEDASAQLPAGSAADTDRLVVSDVSTSDNEMKYMTLADMKLWLQSEIELAAARIVSGTFPTARIADSAITTAKIASGAVSNDKMGGNAVGAGNIQSNAVTNVKVLSISGDKVTSGTVAAARIANLAASKITSGTFSTARIADNAVTLTKLAHGTPDKVIGFNSSGVPTEVDGGSSSGVTADQLHDGTNLHRIRVRDGAYLEERGTAQINFDFAGLPAAALNQPINFGLLLPNRPGIATGSLEITAILHSNQASINAMVDALENYLNDPSYNLVRDEKWVFNASGTILECHSTVAGERTDNSLGNKIEVTARPGESNQSGPHTITAPSTHPVYETGGLVLPAGDQIKRGTQTLGPLKARVLADWGDYTLTSQVGTTIWYVGNAVTPPSNWQDYGMLCLDFGIDHSNALSDDGYRWEPFYFPPGLITRLGHDAPETGAVTEAQLNITRFQYRLIWAGAFGSIVRTGNGKWRFCIDAGPNHRFNRLLLLGGSLYT